MSALLATALALATAVAVNYEGLSLTPYKDPVGEMTICYGHTRLIVGAESISVEPMTKKQCDELLAKDMTKALTEVSHCQGDNLPASVFAAMGDAVFNVGPRLVCGDSTISKKLAIGDYEGACQGLLQWNKMRVNGQLTASAGLTNRRTAEQKLCMAGVRAFTPSKIAFLGDSVTVGAQSSLAKRFVGAKFDAVVGRTMREGLTSPQIKKSLENGDTTNLVIALGANGGIDELELNTFLEKTSLGRVVLVTNTGAKSWVAMNNELLTRVAAKHPFVRLADWSKLVAKDNTLVVTDGVHLTPRGVSAFTKLIAEELSKP